MQAFGTTGLYPWNVEEPLKNKRTLDSNESFYQISESINSKRIIISGKCLTDKDVIQQIKDNKKVIKEKKEIKK